MKDQFIYLGKEKRHPNFKNQPNISGSQQMAINIRQSDAETPSQYGAAIFR